jgi:hypothetical protein
MQTDVFARNPVLRGYWYAVAQSADEVITFGRRIGLEDKTMLERIPGVLPLEVAATASMQADRPSLAWRRQFAALLQEVA